MTSELMCHLAIIQLWPVVSFDNVMNTWHIKKLRLFMQTNLFPSKVSTLLGESSVCNHRSEIGRRFTLWIHISYIYLSHPKIVVNLSSHTIPTDKLQHQYTLTWLHWMWRRNIFEDVPTTHFINMSQHEYAALFPPTQWPLIDTGKSCSSHSR